MSEQRICDVGCGKPIVPLGTAVMMVEDEGTPDEYRGWMHPGCIEERVAILNQIAALLGIGGPND